MNSSQLSIQGLAASQGIAEGTVHVFTSGDATESFGEGDVLVATLTDPTMVQAMIRASAIVTDLGGITSHPAIISREMGIPCVVNTQEGTKVLKNGMRVRVDGTSGIVYVLD